MTLERRYLDAVSALPRERLPADAQLTYDLFKRERELAVESFTYPAELMPVNPFRSVPLEFARTGTGIGPYAILSAKDLENWQLRLEDYVRWTDEAIANLREGLRRGYAEPRVLVDEMLPMLGALAEDTPVERLLRPAALASRHAGRAGAQAPLGGHQPRREEQDPAGLSAGCAIFCATSICRERGRASACRRCRWASPGMRFLVRRETGSRLKPAELHAIGVAETERLRGRLQAVLAEAGFAGTAQAFYEAMHREPRTAFKTAGGAAEFLRSAQGRGRRGDSRRCSQGCRRGISPSAGSSLSGRRPRPR